ncbi:MAG: septum formation initiator family protein [Candidatus Omnitrophica bacterium]|nr:septum formation initiator family protein [Candidatus Omnitrophota bacterium]MCF7892005.1 septum formation initiator family protein [Candidatus Omnitrophota bacterium]MCF7896005.1 septum formation initiator family protein [Candidatus Omnitrophota bacterium]MCF7897535.1 septum formation initiator family protein [Candidatus Omnitrophota bacterium]MCF7909250.1 septum formation initiator family protein [Candidatus Omnitrophota bacterium]
MAGKLLNIKRAKLLQLLLAAIVIFILAMLVYFPNYSKLKNLREENQKLISKNNHLKKEIKEYEIKNKKLKEDHFIYEKIAREKLGFAREGEIVVDIEE